MIPRYEFLYLKYIFTFATRPCRVFKEFKSIHEATLAGRAEKKASAIAAVQLQVENAQGMTQNQGMMQNAQGMKQNQGSDNPQMKGNLLPSPHPSETRLLQVPDQQFLRASIQDSNAAYTHDDPLSTHRLLSSALLAHPELMSVQRSTSDYTQPTTQLPSTLSKRQQHASIQSVADPNTNSYVRSPLRAEGGGQSQGFSMDERNDPRGEMSPERVRQRLSNETQVRIGLYSIRHEMPGFFHCVPSWSDHYVIGVTQILHRG